MSPRYRARGGRRLPWARELGRLSGLGRRRIGLPAPWSAGLVLVLAAIVALPFAGWWLLARTAAPAETLAEARTLLGRPPALDSARYAAWRHVLAAAKGADESDAVRGPAVGLVEPPLPPGICAAPAGEGWGPVRPAVAERAREIVELTDRLGTRPADRDELQRALIELRNTVPDSPAEILLLRYNGARAYLALDDAPSANQVSTGDLEGAIDREIAPILASATHARGLLARGATTHREAALAFHARYLAGAVALERGLGADAVRHFRLALNAANYELARRPGIAGHHVRTPMPLGDSACSGPDEAGLSSLDAYLGLVAAYLRSPDFTDPSRLAAEVARDVRLDIEPSDPFLPYLRHVRTTGASDPMPEHFVWAMSNLQRLSHFNRGDPHIRIEAARALLALEAVGRPAWNAAAGVAEVCPPLRRIAGDLGPAGRRASAFAEPRFAAAALLAHGALEADCGPAEDGPNPQTQSAWLTAAGDVLGDGTAAFAEGLRRELQGALAVDRPDVAAVAEVLRTAEILESELEDGRRPSGFERVPDPAAAARFLDGWRRSVHFDVALELVSATRAARTAAGGGAAARLPIVDRGFVAVLDDLAAHAGRAPDELYGAAEFAAGHPSRWDALLARVRYEARSHPPVAWAVLGLLAGALLGVTLLANLSLWRARLYRTSFYRAEVDPESLAPRPESRTEAADRVSHRPA